MRKFVTFSKSETGEEVKPALTFRVFAEGNRRRHFVEIYVWRLMHQMRALKQKQARRTLAFWGVVDEQRNELDRRGRKVGSRKLGEIHLCLKHVTLNTLAHEAYHATCHFARRTGSRVTQTAKEEAADKHAGKWHSGEERNARFIGHLTDAMAERIMRYHGSQKSR